MEYRKLFGIIGVLITSLILNATSLAKNPDFVSYKTDTPIHVDGKVDSVWSQAKVTKILVNKFAYEAIPEYEGMKETTISMKSLYDEEHIYFLIQYDDPTLSLARFPWEKQKDSTWKQLSNLDQTGNDSTYYEDKFSFFWNINQKGFIKKGCDRSCHMAENGMIDGIKDTSAGRKYTKQGETIDMWHWKGTRTNPVRQMDDEYVNWDKNNAKDWGRHGDSGNGGYTNNIDKEKSLPAFMNQPYSEKYKYSVMSDLKTKFVDQHKSGDIIGGVLVTPFTGSRGDIEAFGEWKDEQWTLEIKRKLVTNGNQAKTQDVQFVDLKKTYYFGVTVFDNSQINHIYHNGSIKLIFQ